jgi:predicted enzyme related to lactoylglutathione lyase
MKKHSVLLISVLASFCFGFAFNSVISQKKSEAIPLKKVTGIGGIFFKCKDPKKMREWYSVNLGLNTNDYGAVFEWYQGADSTKKGFLQWSPFKETTKYFDPSTKEFMINYRVADLNALVVELKENKVTILDTIESYDYGKFLHILDPEGNKIELWEPNDGVYEKMGKDMASPTTK